MGSKASGLVRMSFCYPGLDAVGALMRARQQLLSFLLRHGRIYEKRKPWTQRHRVWLAGQVFDQPVHQIVFQDYVEAIFTAQDRRDQPVARIEALLPTWSMGPVVQALRGLRGLEMISAVTFVAGIGDLGRFETPSQLMAYLGLDRHGDQLLRPGDEALSQRRVEASRTAARKFLASLSKRVAIRLKCLSLQKKRST